MVVLAVFLGGCQNLRRRCLAPRHRRLGHCCQLPQCLHRSEYHSEGMLKALKLCAMRLPVWPLMQLLYYFHELVKSHPSTKALS